MPITLKKIEKMKPTLLHYDGRDSMQCTSCQSGDSGDSGNLFIGAQGPNFQFFGNIIPEVPGSPVLGPVKAI